MKNSFTRLISPTERLYFSMQKIASPFAIQLIVEGKGKLNIESLRTAVNEASEACPGARLIEKGKSWVDSGVSPHIKIIDNIEIDLNSTTGTEVLNANFEIPGATTEIILLRRATTTSIIFRAFHGVMDAKGLGLWATDVFRVLRGETPRGAKDTTSDKDIVAQLEAPGKPTVLLPTFSSPLGPSKQVSGAEKFRWKHRTINGKHSFVVAKIAALLADVNSGPTRIMIPIDLRRHDDTIHSTANLALPLFLNPHPEQTWSDINAQIIKSMIAKTELNEMKNGGLAKIPGPIAQIILQSIHSASARTNKNLASATVSHVGDINFEQFSTDSFEAVTIKAIPAHTGLVPVSFAIIDSGENTEITLSYRNGYGISNKLDKLLDRISSELENNSPQQSANYLRAQSTQISVIPVTSQVIVDETVTALFKKNVYKNPDAIALSSPKGEFSYKEIYQRANAIAHTLVNNNGVEPGDLIAIVAGRTIEGITGQLGILFAGAAFLPLDPKHPIERRTQTIADSRAKLVLIQRVFAEEEFTCNALTLEDFPLKVSNTIDVEIAASNTAYVTYTSGSTGSPKGVAVPHRGVTNYIAAVKNWCRLDSETKFAHYHTPAADMACAAFFTPLLTGGCVTLVPDDISHISLEKMLKESGANTFLFTPSLLEVILKIAPDIPAPRVLLIGGEQFNPELAMKARNFFDKNTQILNVYGPTEVSIICTCFIVNDSSTAAASIPIGKPAVNTSVFLLDENQNPVPAGSVGELYFGGPQVAHGYLGRPELTAEKFVRLRNGELTYRTGDLGKLREDGNLDFLGRIDQQVKIRGNRVEPGEVQTVIEKYEGVEQAAVIGKKIQANTTTLIAYIVAKESITDELLRDFIGAELPNYMVPSYFHRMTELPLSSNGKLDIAQLASLEVTTDANSKIAPPTPKSLPLNDQIFTQLATIWARILRVDVSTLNFESDFFTLGGDSLASVEMFSQVSREIIDTPRQALFVTHLEELLTQISLSRLHSVVKSVLAAEL